MRRRTRRGRMISLGLMFIIYSAINVYSAAVNESPLDPETKVNDVDSVLSATSSADDAINAILSTKSSATISSDADDATESTTPSTTTTTKDPATVDRRGKYRPKRNCTPPAIDQFPPTLLPPAFREHGGLIIHILIAIFTFLGLAIVCDDYFVASLDRICEGAYAFAVLTYPMDIFAHDFRTFFLDFRAPVIAGCCWCHLHGGRKLSTRIGDGHHWRVLRKRRYWRERSDWLGRIQHHVRDIDVCAVLGNCLPFELVAIDSWLLLLFAVHHCDADYYAQRFHFLGKFACTRLTPVHRFDSILFSLNSTRHWRWFCSTFSIALYCISIRRWRNGLIHWNCLSNCPPKRSNRHWWHSKMCRKSRIRKQMVQTSSYNRRSNSSHRNNRNSNNTKDTMNLPSKYIYSDIRGSLDCVSSVMCCNEKTKLCSVETCAMLNVVWH